MMIDKAYCLFSGNILSDDAIGLMNDLDLRIHPTLLKQPDKALSDKELSCMGISVLECEYELRPVQILNILCHIEIWENAYKNEYENILICQSGFNRLRHVDWNVLNNLDFDLLYLHRNLNFNNPDAFDKYLNEELCIAGQSIDADAYILSKSGIKKIVENYLPKYKSMLFPVDVFLAAGYSYILPGCFGDNLINDAFPSKDLKAIAFNKPIIERL